MITFNEVYTKARNAVKEVNESAFVSSTYTPTPSAFPTVFFREVGNLEPNGTVVFSNMNDVREITVEAQIFSNKKSGAKSECDNLLAAVSKEMKKQFFILISSAPVDNIDPSIYRVVARWRRVVGDGDTII